MREERQDMAENNSSGKTARTAWILRIIATAAVITWMVIIFLMSADDGDQSSKKSEAIVDVIVDAAVGVKLMTREEVTPSVRDRIGFYVRKAAHATEYAILGALCVLALAAWGVRRLALRSAFAWPVAAAYAASDEYHQLSVSGRSGEIRDVLIDIAGATVGILLTVLVMCIVRRRRENRQKVSENVTKHGAE